MTTDSSKDFVKASLKRADESIRGAKILLREGELYGAISRAYYCAFHAAKTILYTKGIKAKTHGGIRALFGEHIVKQNIMGKEFADILRDLFNARQTSDYEVYVEFSKDQVEILVKNAEYLLNTIKKLLIS